MNLELASTLPRLANSNPYRTSDLDEARAHIGALFVPHRLDIVGRRQVLDVCISRAQVGGVSLIYHRHGARVNVRPHQPLQDCFVLQIPVRGRAYVNFGQQEVFCSSKQAVMISPALGFHMRFGRGCEQLIVRVERTELEHHLEQHLGRQLEVPLRFAPAVPLTTTGAQELGSVLRLMTASLIDGEGISSAAIGRKHLAELLLSGLLTCLNHNYRDELVLGAGSRKPTIARAQGFMRENLGQPIGPEDIAAAAKVSTRALFSSFKRYLNASPMQYLRELRLDMVRETLLDLDSRQTTVTSVAMLYGFSHLGHFCAAYREKFRESPRETLQRAARRAPSPTAEAARESSVQSDPGTDDL